MSKHTPGPWSWDQSLLDGEFRTILVHGANWAIRAADKNLIVAAPDLLQAAKEALHTLDRLPADTLAVPGVSKHLRDAISKAEGKK